MKVILNQLNRLIDVLPDLIDEDEYSEYYGIFKKNVNNFKF